MKRERWIFVAAFGFISLANMTGSENCRASGAYVDPTKLKKKQGEQTASATGGASKTKEQLEADVEAEKLAKKEALKKALLKGK